MRVPVESEVKVHPTHLFMNSQRRRVQPHTACIGQHKGVYSGPFDVSLMVAGVVGGHLRERESFREAESHDMVRHRAVLKAIAGGIEIQHFWAEAEELQRHRLGAALILGVALLGSRRRR